MFNNDYIKPMYVCCPVCIVECRLVQPVIFNSFIYIAMKDAKHKYKQLRTYYAKKIKKIEKSTRSGAGTAGGYGPKWEFFAQKLFMYSYLEHLFINQ